MQDFALMEIALYSTTQESAKVGLTAAFVIISKRSFLIYSRKPLWIIGDRFLYQSTERWTVHLAWTVHWAILFRNTDSLLYMSFRHRWPAFPVCCCLYLEWFASTRHLDILSTSSLYTSFSEHVWRLKTIPSLSFHNWKMHVQWLVLFWTVWSFVHRIAYHLQHFRDVVTSWCHC